MALSYKRPPDGLLEIFERIYVFDCCFSTGALEQEDCKVYVSNIISQFKERFPESSIKIFNFREGDTASRIASISSEYDITIMDYRRPYEGCPLPSLKVIHHFLKSSESWLSLGQQNVLLMHSEVDGWPVLAFMMAALLLYRKHCTGEFETLDMVHKLAPRDVLRITSPLNPVPSQLRYLQYVSRRTAETEWRPPADKALTLDYVLIRMIPDFDGKGGCCPIIRIYGRDPLSQVPVSPKLLFSTPRRSNNVRYYNQAEGEPVKIDINCHIQGDIVLECISLHDDTGPEKMMYRAMFNTAFIKSNMLMFNRDEIDLRWDAKDQFPKEFSTELLFSEMDAAAASMVQEDSSCFTEEMLPKEAFAKVQEMFSSVDYLVPKNNAAFNRLHEMALSDIIREALDHQMTEASNLLQKLPKRDQDKESITSSKSKLKRSSTESDIYKADGQLQASLHGCTKSISMPPHMNFTCSPPSLSKGPSVSTSSPPSPTPKALILSKTTVVKSQSTKKLKPLRWLKLKTVAQGSLWDEVQKSGEAARASDIDMPELERLFSESTPNSKKAKAKSRAASKPEGVQLIEHIQTCDCEIMLSKLKIPVTEIMDHVLALDDSAMDVDLVENLIKFCPTKEEMEMIQGYKGDLDKLGKREQFFLELMRVPRSEAKLRVFSYKLQFNTRVSDLRKILTDVCLSSEEIRSSVKLRRVMQTILSLGNALNQGTRRGAAVGFRLDSLLNLIETRAAENKNMTLMHYLCKVLAEKQPELLDFSKELSSLEPASKIQLKNAAEKMLAITKGVENVFHEKKLCKKDGHVSKRFRKSLKKFLSTAEGEIKSLASLYSGVGKKVDALICYFGEDPAYLPFEQAVSTLLVFVRMFNQAHEENCKQIEMEKKKAQKEAEQEKKEAEHEIFRPQKEGEKEKLKLQKHSNMESESLRSSPIKSAIALECISLHEKSGEAARESELEHLLSAPHLNSDKAKAESLEEDKTKKGQLILHGKPYETDNKPPVASRVCCSLFWPLIPCGWWWQRWLDSSPYGDL